MGAMLHQHHQNDQHAFSSIDERVVESMRSRTFDNSLQATEAIHHAALASHKVYSNVDDETHEVANSSVYILTNDCDFPKHDLHLGVHLFHEVNHDVGCNSQILGDRLQRLLGR